MRGKRLPAFSGHPFNLYFADVQRLLVNSLLMAFRRALHGSVWIHLCIYYMIASSRARDIFTKIRAFMTSLALAKSVSGFRQD